MSRPSREMHIEASGSDGQESVSVRGRETHVPKPLLGLPAAAQARRAVRSHWWKWPVLLAPRLAGVRENVRGNGEHEQ